MRNVPNSAELGFSVSEGFTYKYRRTNFIRTSHLSHLNRIHMKRVRLRLMSGMGSMATRDCGRMKKNAIADFTCEWAFIATKWFYNPIQRYFMHIK